MPMFSLVARRTLPLLALSALMLCGASDQPGEGEARKRFVGIVAQMEKLRFCRSNRCRYEKVRWQVTRDTVAGRPYKGLIRADIVRPSKTIDSGRYVFSFLGGRWQLVSGTETTDVNDATYVGDSYEFTSHYGRTPISGKLSDPESSLETGYKQLYLQILDRGRERQK